MADEKKQAVPIDYELTGDVSPPETASEAVTQFLKQEGKKERTRKRDARRFLDADGYVEGQTELLTRELGQGLLDTVAENERNAILNNAVIRLEPRQRAYILAYYYDGYTVQEIADMEVVSKVVVSRALSKARKELKYYLQHHHKFGGC